MKKKSRKLPPKKQTAMRQKRTAPSRKTNKNFPIVGIGASAGGLEPSGELLEHLRSDLGMAYVFIHHLPMDFDSNMAEILQRKTPMPVLKVKGNVKLESDHVYVISPDTFIAVEDSRFRLKKRTKRDIPYHPIDYFLISLARARQHRGIGVLLSGTARDGTLGLKAIKASGGITFAQDDSAKHSEMPGNAREAGYVDFVLSPRQMAQELASLRERSSITPAEPAGMKDDPEIREALDIILHKKGVDFFSHYKKNTIYRRIMRRMALQKFKTITDYVKALSEDVAEVEALYQDFLINVTSFFREPDFYKVLVKTVFPKVVKNLKPSEAFRVWIAGCASGEEAYSTAICLSEFLQAGKLSNPVQIFSTDLNKKAIEKARHGIYPENLVQHIPPQRLAKFFVKLDGRYQIIKSIREMCIFSEHNLLKDPPFSRIDVISCQNVLIYLEPGPQRRIFQVFHYALKPSGFLLLGKSESAGNALDFFEPVAKNPRLFSKIPEVSPRLDFGSNVRPALPVTSPDPTSLREENEIEKQSDKILLSRYVPASVLVNKDLGIIRFRGSISQFLEPASGKASLNLLKMIRGELLFDVRACIQEAKRTGIVATRENVIPESRSKRRSVVIEVAPLHSGKDVYFLVVFKEGTIEVENVKRGKASKSDDGTARIKSLEQSLLNAREQIRATTEDFEGTREELQSANEEILSSNEELQSINEELETSKEELQSSNEELTTINEELQIRNVELKQSKDYAEAIIHTMRGPLMVLNPEMRVQTANKAFYEFFSLEPDRTVGALVYNVGNGRWIPSTLDERLRAGFAGSDFKDLMVTHDFPGIGNRTLIINVHRLVLNQHDSQSLTLLSFEDITRYKKAEQSLLETQAQLKLALGAGSVGTWSWNIHTDEIKTSGEEEKLYGYPPGKTMTSFAEWEKSIHPLDLITLREVLKRCIEDRFPLDTEFRIIWPDGSTHWILAKGNTYYDNLGRPERILGVNIDITERRTAVEALAESEKMFHSMSDNAPVMIWMAGSEGEITFLNKTWLSFRGRTLEQESGKGWFEGIHPDDKNLFMEAYDRAFKDHREFKIDYRLKRHDGEYRWIMTHGVPRFTANDQLIGFIGTCIDITERIDLERQKDDFMSIASHELKTPVTSIKAYAQILHDRFLKANDEASANMLARLDSQIDKLTGLINTLLDVAKVQSGKMDYFEESFDIRDFVAEVTEDLQRTFPTHKIISRVETNGNVYGDKARLAQVLNNLITNAVKYSRNASDVIVVAKAVEDNYVFSVQDFGVGIPKDVQDKVFGRFFRVSDISRNHVSGLGLGLFIASQIAKQHGGKLWLESQPGKGSSFFFSLPMNKDPEAGETLS